MLLETFSFLFEGILLVVCQKLIFETMTLKNNQYLQNNYLTGRNFLIFSNFVKLGNFQGNFSLKVRFWKLMAAKKVFKIHLPKFTSTLDIWIQNLWNAFSISKVQKRAIKQKLNEKKVPSKYSEIPIMNVWFAF